MLVDLARRGTLSTGSAWGGFFLGSGGFQIFDGLVNHKVLRLHQVRDVENVLPYDIAWNAAGVVLVLIGVSVIARTGRTMSAQAERSGR